MSATIGSNIPKRIHHPGCGKPLRFASEYKYIGTNTTKVKLNKLPNKPKDPIKNPPNNLIPPIYNNLNKNSL